MALVFVVEDGTGLSTATSFLSIADMKQYWDNMGYDYSSLESATIKQYLNLAAKALDGQYGSRWPGLRGTISQGLLWPRIGACYYDRSTISSSVVPDEVEDAIAELAYIISTGTAVTAVNSNSSDVKRESVSVAGAISESKEYWGLTRMSPVMPTVVNALVPILGTGTAVKLVRV